MQSNNINLTAVFEYVGDCGYIAYLEEQAQMNAVGITLSEAKKNLYKRIVEAGKFNIESKSIKIESKYKILIPKLHVQG
jgi:predicted RNase H-like HicB family nuclease